MPARPSRPAARCSKPAAVSARRPWRWPGAARRRISRASTSLQIPWPRPGGNALIGRQLRPLLAEAGFKDVRVRPRMVYVDASRPGLADGFTRKTFIAMIEGVREASVAAGLIEPERFDAGLQALHRTTGSDGVFRYTFFKGVGEKA